MAQAHSKFKVFVGKSGKDVIEQAQEFVAAQPIRPISLGVEYLEGSEKVVLSLGYALPDEDNRRPARTSFEEVSLGKLDLNPELIASALEDAARKLEPVICHEFYVNKGGEYFVIFMRAMYS